MLPVHTLICVLTLIRVQYVLKLVLLGNWLTMLSCLCEFQEKEVPLFHFTKETLGVVG